MTWKSFSLGMMMGGLLWCVGGCGDSDQNRATGTGGGGAKALTIDPGELPVLGGYVPPLDSQVLGLDENRLKVPYPKGWVPGPRMGKAIVWFKESKQHDYPQILVSAEDFDAVMNVTASTVSEFVRVLSSQLRKKNPDLQAASIRLGDRYGALYRRLGRVKSEFSETEVERLVLETVVEGRKYAFELRTYPGHAEKYAPYLYAVFSGTKFLKSGGPAEGKPLEKANLETPSEKPTPKSETQPESPKTQPTPEKPPSKPEPAPEKPKSEEKPQPQPKPTPETKPPEEKPQPKSEPAEKPKKKKKLDFDIVE